MYFALGVLSAGLVGLVLMPPFWRRALRLARRDMERSLPMTPDEIAAEKDQIRVGHALAIRRLETTLERLEAKTAEQTVELNRRRDLIHRLAEAHGGSADDLFAIERREAALAAALAARDQQIAALEAASAELVDKSKALLAAEARIETLAGEAEAHRLERIASETELGNLRDAMAAAKTGATGESVRRAELETELSTLRTTVALERQRATAREARLAAAEAELARLAPEAARRAGEIAVLKTDLAAAQLAAERAALQPADDEEGGDNLGKAMDALRAEKDALEARVEALEAETARLETALSAVPPAAPSALDETRAAALRDKLDAIAAAVLRLAGPMPDGGSPPIPEAPSVGDPKDGAGREPPGGASEPSRVAVPIAAPAALPASVPPPPIASTPPVTRALPDTGPAEADAYARLEAALVETIAATAAPLPARAALPPRAPEPAVGPLPDRPFPPGTTLMERVRALSATAGPPSP